MHFLASIEESTVRLLDALTGENGLKWGVVKQSLGTESPHPSLMGQAAIVVQLLPIPP